jgi:hypothetical protein
MNIADRMPFAMWIPTPVYEALPYLYVIGGVLFISGTMYIGFSAPGATLYVACGLISIVYGAVIFAKRHAHRKGLSKTTTDFRATTRLQS